ncbi:MAG TPA: hypothetical protein VIX37_14135, partial [Candidatus Sulfotelmatobacter sp.]
MGFGWIGGSGSGGGAAFPEAPTDGETWGRRNSDWSRVVAVAGDTMTGRLNIGNPGAVAATQLSIDVPEAPVDGVTIFSGNPVWRPSLTLLNNINSSLQLVVLGTSWPQPEFQNCAVISSGHIPIAFVTYFGEVMRLTDGRVLIGTRTDDNNSRLQVNGLIRSLADGVMFPDNTVQTTAAFADAPFTPWTYGRAQNTWVQVLATGGGEMTGRLILAGDPVLDLEAATKQYVDSGIGAVPPPPALVGGTGIVLVPDPGPPETITIDSELYNWQQAVNANNNRLNNVFAIGVGGPAEVGVGLRYVGVEGIRSTPVSGETYTLIRVMITTASWGALVAWGPTAPALYANTISLATGLYPVVIAPNNSEVLRVATNNRVGIMQVNPAYTLDVTGQIRCTAGYVFPDGSQQTTAAIADAPFTPWTYGRSQNTWVQVLPLSGGDMTGPLILASNPTANLEAATKQYVDTLATGAIHFIGNLNASLGSVQYAQGSGFIDGPLVPAASAPGGFVIVVIAGTVPPGGPIGGMVLIVGDWVLSNGIAWSRIAIGAGSVSASQVRLAPSAFGADEVQAALTNAEVEVNNRVRLTGDTMTGLLTLSGNPTTNLQATPRQYVDLRGMPSGGFQTQALTKLTAADYDTAWTSVPLEAPADNLAYGRRSLQWSRVVNVGGDTMTGSLTAADFTVSRDNFGYAVANGGWFYKAATTGLMLRQTTGNEQPQIENNNGTNRRVILDAVNGVTLTTAQTISGAKTFSAGISFGAATVTAQTDLTRHVRLFATTGNSGYGFSVSSLHLNYVIDIVTGQHAFLTNAIERAIIDQSGITVPVDDTGLITYAGGRFYKATGTGIVIRAATGNVQPQIENNDGTNRRAIMDSLNGVTLATAQTISATKTFTANQAILGNINWLMNRTTVTVRPGLLWQENGVSRWKFQQTLDAAGDLVLTPYNDTGTQQPDVITFNRATGLATVAANPTANLGVVTKQYSDLNNFHYTAEAQLPAMNLDLLIPPIYRPGEYSLGSALAFTNLPPGLPTTGAASNRFILMMSHANTGADVFQVLYDIAQDPARIWTRYRVDNAATWSAWALTASSAAAAGNFVLKAGDTGLG